MEDCCVVCAEPLDYTAYASCGHKEACSRCVTRLRFVLRDKRCVICQQQSPAVVATRNLGTYTKLLPAQDFARLQDLVKEGELHYLPAAEAYFDDGAHLDYIRSLCSYTHPALEGQQHNFSSLERLQQHVQKTLQLSFCPICLESRKVFISEQILYNKQDLERHQRQGDLTGPLAESGFKGHPNCRFCRKRVYGDNELFQHMQQGHEQCFLCRKARPDKFVYYRDYRELEEHFQTQHFACDHDACLERKFVVFATQQELKQHQGKEHAGGMSAAERRRHLNVPINLQYSREEQAQQAQQAAQRQGITIGGAGGHTSQFRLRDRSLGLAAATQASLDTARAEAASQAAQQANTGLGDLSMEDFPAAGQAPGGAPGGAQSAAPGRWAGAISAAGGQGGLRAEDFPALPGTSKSAKKRMKEQHKTARPADATHMQPSTQAENGYQQDGAGPAVQPLLTRPSEPDSQEVAPPTTSSNRHRLAPLGVGTGRRASSARSQADDQSSYPALGGRSAAEPAQSSSTSLASWGPSQAAQSRPTSKPPGGPGADFPALQGRPTRPAAPVPSRQGDAGAEGPPPAVAGHSASLKAANKALLSKIRQRVSEDAYAEITAAAGQFMAGSMPAEAFFGRMQRHSISGLVPDMAALLQDTAKREALLSAYADSLQEGQTTDSGWTPPEAAQAAVQHVQSAHSWSCPRCTLVNAPAAAACEVCSAARPAPSQPQPLGPQGPPGFPALPGSSAGPAEASPPGGESQPAPSAAPAHGMGRKQGKFERLRLGGDPQATESWLVTNGISKTKPNNVWTHGPNQSVHAASSSSAQQGPVRGAAAAKAPNKWAKQPGQLAQQTKVLQDAWGKP